MKKPTIAIIGSKGYPFVYSGYETLVQELCARLKDRYELHVYCHRALFKDRPAKMAGIHLHYLPAIETRKMTHLSHGFISTFHAMLRGYDLYFFLNSCHSPCGYALKMLGRRSVLNTDGLEWLRPQIRGLARLYYYWSSRRSTRAFDQLVCDAYAMADIYRQQFNADSEVIAYGANLVGERDDSVLKKFGLSPGEYYLAMGRLVSDNNADLLVDGFLRSGTKRKFVIVGDTLFPGKFSRGIQGLASDQIIFTGFMRDPKQILSLFHNSYSYLHAHEFGGTNPSLLQALAAGCCVLSLDTVFNREVLLDNVYGSFFSKSAESLAALIQKMDRDTKLVHAYRTNAPERIRHTYTWDLIASKYDNLFRRLLGLNSVVESAA